MGIIRNISITVFIIPVMALTLVSDINTSNINNGLDTWDPFIDSDLIKLTVQEMESWIAKYSVGQISDTDPDETHSLSELAQKGSEVGITGFAQM